MANPSSSVDLHQSTADFEAANAELYALKVNRLSRWLPIDSRARAVAQWSNHVDDFLLEAQSLLRLQRNGSGSPQGAVAAEVGTLYLDTQASPSGSRMWVKATGTGTTGWEQVGGLSAGDVTLDLIEDAPAVSVLARAGNTSGVRADLVSGGGRRVLASSSTNAAIAFRALESADIPALDYIPTSAITGFGSDLIDSANAGAALTTLGVSAFVQGLLDDVDAATFRASIGAGTSTIAYGSPVAIGTALADGGNTSVARSDHVHTLGAAALEPARTLYEVNFAAQGSNTFTDGTEVVDGLSYTVPTGVTAMLGTFGLDGSTGLRMIAGTSLGTHATFTSVTQDAPHFYLPLSSVPNWNGTSDLVVELYIPTLTLETTNEYIFCALWVPSGPHGTSAQRVRKFTWINIGSGNIAPSITSQTAQTNGSEVRAGQTIMSVRFRFDGTFLGSWSTYSSGWVRPSGTMQGATNSATVDPMLLDSARIVIGMGVLNDASPTTGSTVAAMRLRAA